MLIRSTIIGLGLFALVGMSAAPAVADPEPVPTVRASFAFDQSEVEVGDTVTGTLSLESDEDLRIGDGVKLSAMPLTALTNPISEPGGDNTADTSLIWSRDTPSDPYDLIFHVSASHLSGNRVSSTMRAVAAEAGVLQFRPEQLTVSTAEPVTVDYELPPLTIWNPTELAGPPTSVATVGEDFALAPDLIETDYPVQLSSGELPQGLSLDAETGVVSGVPIDTRGAYSLTFTTGLSSWTTEITLDPGAPDTLELAASETSVRQGESVTLTAEASDAADNALGDVTDQVTFTSDVATDEIDGNVVTFPTASTHTITGTAGAATDSVAVDVEPVVEDTAPTPTPPDEVDIDDVDPVAADPIPPAASSPASAALPAAGAPFGPAWLLGAALLTIVGAVLLRSARRATRH